MIETESGIPMPPAKRGRYSSRCPCKYPLRTMEVGESFFVPVSHPANLEKYQCAVIAAAWKIGKKTGKRFTSRQVEGGVRVWRVE